MFSLGYTTHDGLLSPWYTVLYACLSQGLNGAAAWGVPQCACRVPSPCTPPTTPSWSADVPSSVSTHSTSLSSLPWEASSEA